MKQIFSKIVILSLITASLCFVHAQNTEAPSPPKKVGYPVMESPHSDPIAVNGQFVYVTNTPSSTVDVIDRESDKVVERIHVGIEPVSIAVRPDGKEVWVSNHVSDSVSVIDTDPQSPTFHVVIATIQEFDKNKATTFDEPVGIAFASNEKAYIALSSENQIAVIDVNTRRVTKRLKIAAQDPRSIMVKGDKLYVLPFESGNQTQISGGKERAIDGNSVTFDAFYHFLKIDCHNCAKLDMDVVKRQEIPDQDLFIFNTKFETPLYQINTIGTLLYGLTVDNNENIYIANTDARNHVNGKAGTKKHGLSELENRPYVNQITSLDSGFTKKLFNLETKFSNQPSKEDTFATPYAIKISPDGKTFIATAAASNNVFSIDRISGKVLDQILVGSGPRGITLINNGDSKAWIYNAFDNTVSQIQIADNYKLKLISTIKLIDTTSEKLRSGRIHFNAASVSSTETFACASCHPDGHTDHLLWILDTPKLAGGNQIPPRLTNPIRGLRDTEPFHWDGLMGDPYGGITSESTSARVKPRCTGKEDTSCIKHLIDSNLSTLMRFQDKMSDPRGKLSEGEKNDLATYLLSIPYPSAPKRPYSDETTSNAKSGFTLFHIAGDSNPNMKEPNICGNCHRMPFWTSTKTPENILWGMDVPTWRGAYDRHQNQAQGRNKLIDYPWIKDIYNQGSTEKLLWQLSWSGETGVRTRFDPVWDMVLEGSTGFAGAFARQTTVHKTTYSSHQTLDLLQALEDSAAQGKVVLEVEGVFINDNKSKKIEMQFDVSYRGGSYVEKNGDRKHFAQADLLKLAEQGKFVGTFTARHGVKADLFLYPQPALWTVGPIHEQRGRQKFPTLSANEKTMLVSGRHFKDDAYLFVDGQRVEGTVRVKEGEKATIALAKLPSLGMHLLQVQEPEGRISNDFIFHVK